MGGATDSAARMRGEDLAKWQDDPIEFMRGLGNYVMGGRNDVLLSFSTTWTVWTWMAN